MSNSFRIQLWLYADDLSVEVIDRKLSRKNDGCINKGDIVSRALQQQAPRAVMHYNIAEVSAEDDECAFAHLGAFLADKKQILRQLHEDGICLTFNLTFSVAVAESGCSIPNACLKEIAMIGANIEFSFFSYGEVRDS